MDKKDYYFLGKITRKHGLAGNVILKLDTDQPEFYNKLDSLFIEINGLLVPFFVDKQSWQKETTKIISFKNAAEAMVEQAIGKDVYLPLSTLPELTGKQFYYHEVIGFRLFDESETLFGEIQSINDQTAQHYFILNLEEKEIVVPIIKEWIIEVNRKEKSITMQLPEGLLEVFTATSVKDE